MHITKPNVNDTAAQKSSYRKVKQLNRLSGNHKLSDTAPPYTRRESLEEELEKVVLLCRD